MGKLLRCVAVVGCALSLTLAGGCGHRAAPPKAKPDAKQSVPLPEWAPKHPSPEFLRAARVLRGVPMDAAGRGDVPEQTWRAMLAYMKRVNPTLWELFGSMSDDQIDRFLMTKRASLPVRSLTAVQRAALDAVLDANKDNETEIAGVTLGDFRTLLYKMGAKHDLSNVTIGFTIEGANTLSFNARVAGNKDPLQWTGWAQAPRLGPERPAEGSAAEAKPAAAARRPLPEWAPRNPSPQFLRAWKVLKPIPTEEPMTSDAARSGLNDAMQGRVRRIVWPAAYEFFGSLTDEQIDSFLRKKEISIPYKSLPASQRRALEHWFAVWVEAFEGGPVDSADFRVALYKMGAKEDFSNLRVGFGTHDTHVVGVCFWVIGAKKGQDRVSSDFAQL